MKATGSNPVEPTNMREDIDTQQFPLRESEFSRAPVFPIYRVQKGRTVRKLVRAVPLEEPEEGKDPFTPYDDQTKQKLELTPSERIQGYRELKCEPPSALLKEAKEK